MRKFLLIIALVASVFVSCKGKSTPSNVSVNFSLPADNDTIASWNQLHIQGYIESKGDLDGYTVEVYKSGTKEQLFFKSYDIVSEGYNFHEHWMNNVQDTTTVVVEVFAKYGSNNKFVGSSKEVVCLP